MKVKLLTSMAGTTHSYGYGDDVDLPDADAERMIERGMAQPVRKAKPERATDRRSVETTDEA